MDLPALLQALGVTGGGRSERVLAHVCGAQPTLVCGMLRGTLCGIPLVEQNKLSKPTVRMQARDYVTYRNYGDAGVQRDALGTLERCGPSALAG